MGDSADFVTVEWLNEKLKAGNPRIRLIDCHYARLPKPKTNFNSWKDVVRADGYHDAEYRKEVAACHLQGAVHADLEVYMRPAANGGRYEHWPQQEFETYMQQHIGANQGDHLVLYDRGDHWRSVWPSKFWITLKHHGHKGNISILKGGLDAWQAANLPTSSEVTKATPGNWTGDEKCGQAFTVEKLGQDTPIIDCRPSGEYCGSANGPAAGRAVPGAVSLPALEQLCDADGIIDVEKMKLVFSRTLGTNWNDAGANYACLCNSGVQASVLALALHTASGGKVTPQLHVGGYLQLVAENPESLVVTK